MTKITVLTTYDLRFPTSESLGGSDTMNRDPNYSAAYVVLETDHNLVGHGLTFTIGRGNEICIAAIAALRHRLIGLELEWIRKIWDGFGVTSPVIANCVGLGPIRVRSILQPRWWSMRFGTSGRRELASQFGNWYLR